MTNTREAVLSTLFDVSVKKLTELVKSGEASSQDYKNIIQMLKDNGITAEVKRGTPLAGLAEILPFTSGDASLRLVK